jgi:hypothetical protein
LQTPFRKPDPARRIDFHCRAFSAISASLAQLWSKLFTGMESRALIAPKNDSERCDKSDPKKSAVESQKVTLEAGLN